MGAAKAAKIARMFNPVQALRLTAAGCAVLLCTLLPLTAAVAASQDDDFLAAREAFRSGDAPRLERLAKSLGEHPLEPYVAYWRLRLRLEQATAEEVQALLARVKDGPVSNSLRADWLKLLANRQQWEAFDAEYVQFVGEDTELLCLALQARARSGNLEALDRARSLWFSGRDHPESCRPLFDVLAERRMLAEADVWARIRLALEAGNTGVARRAAEYLPAREQPDGALLARIAVNPQAHLERKAYNLKSRAGRESLMFAVQRLARTSPQIAAQHWNRLADAVDEADRAYVWGLIAHQGAQRLDAAALGWYARAGKLSDLQLAWKVRIALRALSWPDVAAAIDAMSPAEAQEPAWRYWKARAFKAQGRAGEAHALFAALAPEYNFYGQLAAEEIGARVHVPVALYKPTRDEAQSMGRTPGLQRAVAFYRLNLRFEGNREWNWTIRGFDDRQLLAASEFARRSEIYDRAINTADRTRETHDFGMRYLAPFRDVMKGYVAQLQLDEAWVYGLIRQESRFIPDVKSSAGAGGLMQLMPATARWVARKIGLSDWQGAKVMQVDTNINLGTWYLKHVLDTLDNHPVLASAAYNAGPGRARAWRADVPMEAAIYTESIPFNETRDYVKKVMSNASYYSQQFGHTLVSLKERIGVIAPRSRAAEKALDEPGG
jgi:soluble lytic murein transglycosylase